MLPRSEIVMVGIIQGKVGIPEVGMIQPQGKFLEEYQLGVAAALGRREGNSVPFYAYQYAKGSHHPTEECGSGTLQSCVHCP